MPVSGKSKGFTLVELAIAITIVGILIGGVLKGAELVGNARVVKTIGQIESYETATKNFLNIYGSLPGDIRAPSAKLPNCTSTECATSGNGDKKICGNPTMACAGWSGVVDTTFGLGSEPVGYWRHLVAADLIIPFEFYENLSAEDKSASPYGSSWHAYGPPSSLGGRFMPVFFNSPASAETANIPAYPAVRGHYLKLTGFDSENGIRTKYAAQIDNKMDDGIPNKGKFMAASRVCFERDADNNVVYAVNGKTVVETVGGTDDGTGHSTGGTEVSGMRDSNNCPFVVSIEN